MSKEPMQRILDSFSVGNLESFKYYGRTTLITDKDIELEITMLKTSRGSFCLVGIDSHTLTSMIHKNREKYIQAGSLEKEIAKSVGFEFSKALTAQPETKDTLDGVIKFTHKFDNDFFLFKL